MFRPREVLSPEDLDRLGALQPAGDRYPNMAWVERDTAPWSG